MANPPKAKGTGGETELLRLLALDGLARMPASAAYDLHRGGYGPPLEVLATRPDNGQWLVTMRLGAFRHLLRPYEDAPDDLPPLHIEVKRYKRFSLHGIFEKKFGGKHAVR